MAVQVHISELSKTLQQTTEPTVKKVLEGILNDYMDLQYGNETPYTTGKTVLPMETTIVDVEEATKKVEDPKFKALFETISNAYKSGTTTPLVNDGTWDPKLKPILVLVKPDA